MANGSGPAVYGENVDCGGYGPKLDTSKPFRAIIASI
jgi:hypothetical protein